MSKKIIQNTTVIAAIIALAINGIKQLIEIDDGEKEKFDWDECFRSTAKGALIGLGVGIVLDQIDKSQEGEPQFRETRYLRTVLQSYDPKSTTEYEFQKRKGQEIIAAIQEEYDQYVLKPEISGSLGKGTGLAGVSDLDVLVPFRKHSFQTLEDMFEDTYSFLKHYAAGDPEIIGLRRQRRSIGLECRGDGITTSIDIVPGKERNNKRSNKDLSLYVNAGDWFSGATYTKTNIQKQKEPLKNNPSKREIIMLLKVWKGAKSVKIKSYELERLVDRAFKDQAGRMPHTLYSKLLMTVTFMYDTIETIALRDLGALSKPLLENKSDRAQIQNKLRKMLNDLSTDSRNLPYYFPKNPSN